MEAFLIGLLSRFLDASVDWRPINYGSKQQLLLRLPARLAGYARIPAELRPRSLVLIDRDDDDCVTLKARLNAACAAANLATRSLDAVSPEVVNRIVCEELEAWFFGDIAALDDGWRGAGRVASKAAYRDPDAVRGGTHEALLRELQRAGFMKGLTKLPKIDTARTMGLLIDPARNTSRSFQHFWTGLTSLIAIG